MDAIEKAWRVIDHWKKDYTDEGDMINEVGDLNELALLIMEKIEELGLEDDDDITFVSSQIEMEIF